MVTASGHIAREPQRQAEPDHVARASLLAKAFAERTPVYDRDGSFPFANFEDLSEAGLLALTVSAALGGAGAGAAEAARILGIIGKADPSTALVLSMHYIQHLVMARSSRWPTRLSRKLARETVDGIALINALRVEPELGSSARGGLPASIARRTETGWRLGGRKIYSTGAPIGFFLVPAGRPGTRIVETWDHLGLRASGSQGHAD
ncbi:acyl-CoA/acyl-ACP dehydrogenase [Bradyrhizobium sp. WSM 1791]|uniref:Acyl-CoA/acyl-ACP dehydrogenase n=1 Tax=Bradyrhizobium australiense TaxID=2721161 RepID=A0A7Y4LTQ3_9BRAD|nr:acyl-CoA/acyl-ACP dehydrogenase [Bradyrhizobium australiense]